MRWMRTSTRARVGGLTVLAFGVAFVGANIFHPNHFPTVMGASSSEAVPEFKFDSDWPRPLPNKWKIGGITGLAVDKDDNVWAYDRPNDLTDIELEAELTPAIADCCKRPPSLIHFDTALQPVKALHFGLIEALWRRPITDGKNLSQLMR